MRFFILFYFIATTLRAQISGFTLTGNPTNPAGATWAYQQTIGSVVYDLTGVLYKPAGNGIFPSVIINHGQGSNTLPGSYTNAMAQRMVQWGYVCIGTNFCHSSGVPCGSPGACDTSQWGAKQNNFLRVLKCWDILASLAYTDTNCIAVFGHSRGAFLTTGVAGAYPYKFSCAGHTAGGYALPTQATYPTLAMVNSVTAPYVFHHGTADVTVPHAHDNNLNNMFTTSGLFHKYYRMTGYTHSTITYDSLMLARTKSFFNTYKCSGTIGIKENSNLNNSLIVFPNPAQNYIQCNAKVKLDFEITNLTGVILFSGTVLPDEKIDITTLPQGIYFIIFNDKDVSLPKKLFISR